MPKICYKCQKIINLTEYKYFNSKCSRCKVDCCFDCSIPCDRCSGIGYFCQNCIIKRTQDSQYCINCYAIVITE